MAHPAYDQCIKASHLFNLLDARGVISVTERQAYIGRVRALAKLCADALGTRRDLWPLARPGHPRHHGDLRGGAVVVPDPRLLRADRDADLFVTTLTGEVLTLDPATSRGSTPTPRPCGSGSASRSMRPGSAAAGQGAPSRIPRR
jgi:hypothetical protein